ncbi:MAG: hypothetical protein ACKPKO_32200 [Candidatus Fonsibacter sp.]
MIKMGASSGVESSFGSTQSFNHALTSCIGLGLGAATTATVTAPTVG